MTRERFKELGSGSFFGPPVLQAVWRRLGRNRHLLAALSSAILVLIGLLLYRPLLGFTFFWEDPFDIGQVDQHSFRELYRIATNDLYYRPLFLTIVKLLGGPDASYEPLPFYLFNVVTRIGAAVLLYGAVNRWFQVRLAGFLSALLFLLCPVSFDSTAKAMSAHQPLLPLVLGSLWSYTIGRETEHRWVTALAMVSGTLALLIHENAVLLPLLVLALEVYLWSEGRVSSFSPLAFFFLLPAVAFGAVWLAIPSGDGNILQWGSLLDKALYVSQSFTFPIARLIAQAGGLGLNLRTQAFLAVMVSLTVLAICYGRKRWSRLLLLLAWGVIASSLLWIGLSMSYLETGSRLLYFPSFVGAVAWGGIIAEEKPQWRLVPKAFIVIAVLVQSWMTVGGLIRLYEAGSDLMCQIQSAAGSNRRTLFVNVPDRFEYRAATYPIGFWGMMLAPVSQDLSDFVRLRSGADVETTSLSDFILLAGSVPHTPYEVYTRGSDAHATERLYEAALWADQTHLTGYHPDGSMELRAVGNIQPLRTTAGSLGRYDMVSQLLSADVRFRQEHILVNLRWRPLRSARPNDTVFLHLTDSAGAIVAQTDGDSLGHLVAPSAWRPGHEVLDRRYMLLPESIPPDVYQLRVGMYNRVDGSRYTAYATAGKSTEDTALEIWTATLSH
ncbi:MAG: hypothetical protein ACOC6F_03960 [bacterium]